MPRAEKILQEHIGMTFLVHSGKDYKRIRVTSQMVNHKYGEFVLTRYQRKRDSGKQKGKMKKKR